MSFAALLDHRVHIVRDVEGSEDDWGHAVTSQEIGGDFPVAIQPKSARDVAAITSAGVTIGAWTLYCAPRVISERDAVVHDTDRCPKPDERDLPTVRFEVTGVRNQTGRGHHLAVDARLVGSSAGVEGS